MLKELLFFRKATPKKSAKMSMSDTDVQKQIKHMMAFIEQVHMLLVANTLISFYTKYLVRLFCLKLQFSMITEPMDFSI